MPQMPTITITEAQQARILEAYMDMFQTDTVEDTVAAYQAWLTSTITEEVLAYERRKIQTQAIADMQAKEAEVRQFLDN